MMALSRLKPTGYRRSEKVGLPRLVLPWRARTAKQPGNGMPRPEIGSPEWYVGRRATGLYERSERRLISDAQYASARITVGSVSREAGSKASCREFAQINMGGQPPPKTPYRQADAVGELKRTRRMVKVLLWRYGRGAEHPSVRPSGDIKRAVSPAEVTPRWRYAAKAGCV